MKPTTREWVRKAEEDWRGISLLRAVEDPEEGPHDLVCFHAQQTAEKYLKAVLVERTQPFPLTHDLTLLLDLATPPLAELVAARGDLETLSRLAVQVRYPGFACDRAKAAEAVEVASRVRRVCRAALTAPA